MARQPNLVLGCAITPLGFLAWLNTLSCAPAGCADGWPQLQSVCSGCYDLVVRLVRQLDRRVRAYVRLPDVAAHPAW